MARILVVDYDRRERECLVTLLEQAGHEVASDVHGATALELFDRDPFQLVVANVEDPEDVGLQALVSLRRRNPEVRIIAIAKDRRGRALTARALGAAYIVVHPVDAGELLQAVRRTLES